MSPEIEAWIQQQPNPELARACARFGEFLNKVRPDLDGQLASSCVSRSQYWRDVYQGCDEVEAYFQSWLRHPLRKVFAELATDPVRREPCLLMHVRDSWYGRMGLGEVRSYLTLRLDGEARIEEVYGISVVPSPSACRRAGLFPGLTPEELQAEVDREGPRLPRSEALGLKLYLLDEYRESSWPLAEKVAALAKRLGLPEPDVRYFRWGDAHSSRDHVLQQGTVILTLDSKNVRTMQNWKSSDVLEEILSGLLAPSACQTRPRDYFHSAGSEAEAVLRRIKGDYRRAFVRAGRVGASLDEIPEEWLAHSLSNNLRLFLGMQDPSFRGGEDLPDLLDGEVEIARLSMQSVHGEVVSLRAHELDDGRFSVRLVDEDEDESEYVLPRSEYDQTLTANEVVLLFRDAEPSATDLSCGFTLSSYFYPDLDAVAAELGLVEAEEFVGPALLDLPVEEGSSREA